MLRQAIEPTCLDHPTFNFGKFNLSLSFCVCKSKRAMTSLDVNSALYTTIANFYWASVSIAYILKIYIYQVGAVADAANKINGMYLKHGFTERIEISPPPWFEYNDNSMTFILPQIHVPERIHIDIVLIILSRRMYAVILNLYGYFIIYLSHFL